MLQRASPGEHPGAVSVKDLRRSHRLALSEEIAYIKKIKATPSMGRRPSAAPAMRDGKSSVKAEKKESNTDAQTRHDVVYYR